MSEEMSVEDALNEYYKLKRTFENKLDIAKREIWAMDASKKEKRAQYLKLQPKCVNCNKASKAGTFFTMERIVMEDKTNTYRRLKCHCGNVLNPCGLNIEIHLGDNENLVDLMREIKHEIDLDKRIIIEFKNKLLFGLMQTEEVLDIFNLTKEKIQEYTNLYGKYLELWNNIVDNPEKKRELNDSMVEYYQHIQEIKEAITQMNATNKTSFADNVANMYVTQMMPLLSKIQHLKYGTNTVYVDDANRCKLVQIQHMFDNVSVPTNYEDRVVSYVTDLHAKEISIKITPQTSPSTQAEAEQTEEEPEAETEAEAEEEEE